LIAARLFGGILCRRDSRRQLEYSAVGTMSLRTLLALGPVFDDAVHAQGFGGECLIQVSTLPAWQCATPYS
jgi:hypothetical protein